MAIVYAVINGYLNDIPVKKVNEYEQLLFDKLENEKQDLLERIEQGFFDECDIEELKSALNEIQR